MPAKTSRKSTRQKAPTPKGATPAAKPRAGAADSPWEDWGDPAGPDAPAPEAPVPAHEPTSATDGVLRPKADRELKAPPKRPTAPDGGPTTADGGPKTLKELSDRYVAHLKAQGKTESTVWGYGMELNTAQKELGEDTKLSAITPAQVEAFYRSDRVTRKRNGTPKAMPGILKTRRVIRLALVWAVEQGWLAEAPVPDLEAKKKEAE